MVQIHPVAQTKNIMCDKKSFDTLKEANRKITEIRTNDKTPSRKPIRAYLCKECRKFHITGMNRKEYTHAMEDARERQHQRSDEVKYWCSKLGVNNRGEQLRHKRK